MKALTVASWGATPRIAEVDEPKRGPGRSRVRVLAAGLNPVDLAIGSGRFYGETPSPPFTPGAELVGEVVESDTHPPGMRAWALTTVGAFAEFAVVADEHLIPIPDDVTDTAAAAFGIAGLAGWMSVVRRGELRPGETVLVLGSGGVVGQVAIQAARHAGAGAIVAVSRSPRSGDSAMELGADRFVAISEALGDDLRTACAPGADLIVDMLWAEPAAAALGAAAQRARLVQVGNAAGATATIPGGTLRGGRFDVRGFSVFSEEFADVAGASADLLAHVAAGSIRLDIASVPLAEAPAAWASQLSGTAGRKLVLVNG